MVEVTQVPVQQRPQYMGHEVVYRIHDADAGITAFVGIHNTVLGPALGGIRYKSYEDEDAAIRDVLRLSEAMTWKNSAAGLNHGGGKSVIIAKDGEPKPTHTTLEVIAQGLNIINQNKALYFGAEDMNISPQALDHMATITEWIKGATPGSPDVVGGNPSPFTAMGVFECLKRAVKHKMGKDDIKGIRVSLQGLGSVGQRLAELLHEDGAVLTACDTIDTPFNTLTSKGVHVTRVGLNDIYDVPADIFAPNAIGGTLTDETIPRLKAAGVQIVCGAANNQQVDQIGGSQSKLMHEIGILYCPDYIVNAAGVIWVAKVGENAVKTEENIRTGVPRRFQEVLDIASRNPDQDMASIAATYSHKRVEKKKVAA